MHTSDSAPYPQVIALGETMALVASEEPVSLEVARRFQLDAGGAESNLAAHLAAAGVATAWVSALGDDALGRRVERIVRSRGVDTRWVSFSSTAPTGVYFKDPGRGVLYYRNGSAASWMSAESLSGIPLESADIVHVSGITPALSRTCAAMIDHLLDRLAATSTRVSFDVNYRAPLWSVQQAAPVLRALAQRSDVVFVGLDEAETLWGCESAAQVRELLPQPASLVVKDSDVGATEFSGAEHAFVPAHTVEVVEAVGAGDAFAGGYLQALITGADAIGRLTAGHDRAALVLRSMTDFVTNTQAEEHDDKQ